jgi:cyanophycinase
MTRLLLALVILFVPLGPSLAQAPVLPPVAELRGALVIAGGGRLPDVARERFVALAGREKAKIVVIPTASQDADDEPKHDLFLAPWKKFNPASITLLHTRDRKQANDPAFIQPLIEATAVWISGGNQSRVTAAYQGTLVEKELRKLLDRGGVIGGTSAGAAVMSDPMITGGRTTASTAPGFGWLPGFVIDQHFVKRNRQDRLRGVLDAHPGVVGLGIDEGTAVVVQGRRLTGVGDSTATVILSPGANRPRLEQTLKAGDVADLFQLRRAAANRAAEDPFPPKEPSPPVVESGALVIVGGGGTTPEIMNRFFNLAGGKDALIVVVPTASEQQLIPDDPGDAKYLRRWGATNVKVLHTRDRNRADEADFSHVLTEAKGVWFGGGRQWRFVDAYEGTLTEKRFHDVLARGGVIGGSSAGASIQSEYMPRGHPLGNTVMAAEGYERGFGFLPGAAVDQHFFARKRTSDMSGLMRRYPQYLGIGIDEGTAVVVQGSVAEVIGRSKAAFYDYRNMSQDGEQDYIEVLAGEKYDLKERKKIP